MQSIRSFVRRHPLAVFVFLAYAFSWAVVIPTRGLLLPWGPAVAAFIVLALTEGRRGVKTLLRRMVRWRVNAGWYLAALLLPVLISLAAVSLAARFGAQPAPLSPWSAFLTAVPIFLVIGGEWEEPGWSGFALPVLQTGRSALAASLLVGLVRIVWHLPLFLYGHISLADIPLILAAQIVITWLFNSSRGSVLVVMLHHLIMNVCGEFFGPVFSGADAEIFAWARAGIFVAVALLILAAAGPKRLSAAAPATMDAENTPVQNTPAEETPAVETPTA